MSLASELNLAQVTKLGTRRHPKLDGLPLFVLRRRLCFAGLARVLQVLPVLHQQRGLGALSHVQQGPTSRSGGRGHIFAVHWFQLDGLQ